MEERNIIFLGYYFPQDYLEDNINKFYLVPFASNRLQEGILKGLINLPKSKTHILSFLPTTEFPKSRFLVAQNIKGLSLNNVPIKTLPFLNILLLKHLTKAISLFISLSAVLLKTKGNKTIMVYNLNSVTFLIMQILGFVFNFRTSIIIADMPMAAMPNENKVIALLRKLDQTYIKSSLKKIDGLVVLSKHVIKDFFPNKKHLVIEGMITDKLLEYHSKTETTYENQDQVVFTYIGRLSSFQNVDGLINDFMKVKNDKLRLVLCGKGELVDFISKAKSKDNRIIYDGFIPDEKLQNRVKETSYFISPKLLDDSFSKYSFPSKLIEYMAYGKPTVSFDLPCIPDDYRSKMILLPNREDALLNFMKNANLENQEDIQIGKRGKQFILSEKNVATQTAKITEFVSTL